MTKNNCSKETYLRDTQVSTYDKTSALLVALIIVTSMVTLLAFMVWVMSFELNLVGNKKPWEPVMQPGPEEEPELVDGDEQDPEEPGAEFPEAQTPQVANSLLALTTAVSSVPANKFEKLDGNAELMGPGFGPGERRIPGTWIDDEILPEPNRWRIDYSATTPDEYFEQLEHFNVELGAVSRRSNRIDLISNLTDETPDTDVTDKASEKRIYFSYQTGRLKRWDLSVARKAGVDDIEERIIVQFYEEDVREILRKLEEEAITRDNKSLEEVKRCHFKVKSTEDGFEFYIDEILYRPLPRS